MTPETLKGRFERKLAESFSASWGHRAPLTGRLVPETVEQQGTGGLEGAIEIYARADEGQDVLIHREAFDAVDSPDKVDDVIARALGIVLMKHPDWPR